MLVSQKDTKKHGLFWTKNEKGCFLTYRSHRIHGTGIFTHIYHECMVNIGKHSIHGSYGDVENWKTNQFCGSSWQAVLRGPKCVFLRAGQINQRQHPSVCQLLLLWALFSANSGWQCMGGWAQTGKEVMIAHCNIRQDMRRQCRTNLIMGKLHYWSLVCNQCPVMLKTECATSK